MSIAHALFFGCFLSALTPSASAQSQPSRSATPLSAPAQASGAAPKAAGDYLSRMDIDGDRKVSLLEYQDWLTYAFDGMDRNRDGLLTPDEQPGGRGKPITRDAHRARVAERFARQDIDRSGFLDAKEIAAPPQGK